MSDDAYRPSLPPLPLELAEPAFDPSPPAPDLGWAPDLELAQVDGLDPGLPPELDLFPDVLAMPDSAAPPTIPLDLPWIEDLPAAAAPPDDLPPAYAPLEDRAAEARAREEQWGEPADERVLTVPVDRVIDELRAASDDLADWFRELFAEGR